MKTTAKIFGEEQFRRQIFSYFKLHFHNEGLDCEKNYFEMFFCDWPILYQWKISAFTVQPFMYFVKKLHIFIIFVGKIFFLQNIYGFTPIKKKLSDLGQNWAKTKQLLLKRFQLPIAMKGCIVQWCLGKVVSYSHAVRVTNVINVERFLAIMMS